MTDPLSKDAKNNVSKPSPPPTRWALFKEKCIKQPWVPIAAVLSLGVVAHGAFSIRKGDSVAVQKALRVSAFLQIFALTTAILGSKLMDKTSLPKHSTTSN